MTALTREDILKPQHRPFTCPDRGEILLLPYVSHGAFVAFLRHRDDPRQAFTALVEQSLGEGAAPREFGDADCDAIARFYAQTMGCAEAYDAARGEQGVFGAFRTALAATALWRSYQEDERRLAAQLRWTRIPSLDHVVWEMSRLDDVLRQATRRLVPEHLLRAPVLAPFVQSALLNVRSQMLMPRIDAITNLAALASRSVAAWESLSQGHVWAAESVRAFDEQMRWMTQVSDQIVRMQHLVTPVPDISRTLQHAAERMLRLGVNADALADTDAAIASLSGVVDGTNDYFSRDRILASPVLRPALPAEATPQERGVRRSRRLGPRCRRDPPRRDGGPRRGRRRGGPAHRRPGDDAGQGGAAAVREPAAPA